MAYIYVAYSKADTKYARSFAERLLKEGFDVWIGDEGTDPDAVWQTTLKAIASCDALAVIMSAQALEERHVEREVRVALEQGKPVFPLLLEGEVWSEFEGIRYVDVSDGRLPWPGFFDELAQHVDRRDGRGKNITK